MRKLAVFAAIVFIACLIYVRIDKSPSSDAISQALSDWKETAQIFHHEGYRISYHDTGEKSKEVIVLLHGYPTSSFDWEELWSDLSLQYRLVAMDMLGYGLSDKPDTIEYAISDQTDILEGLLDHLQISEVHLLAHDVGDNIAQELLARALERIDYQSFEVKSVALLNGGLFPETHKPTTIQSLLKSPIGGVVSSLANQTLFDRSYSKVFGPNTKPTTQHLIDQWYLVCQQGGNKINHKLIRYIQDRIENRERWVGALQQTNVPLLLIDGLLDPVSGEHWWRDMLNLYLTLKS